MGENNTTSSRLVADPSADLATTFIARWSGVTASELSTAQSFVRELCDLLGTEPPHPTAAQDYMFERPITFSHGDGSSSAGRIDCYRRGHFVLEAKKLRAGVATKGFDDALLRARAQAEGYARALPAAEGRPPFLLVVDVGNVIELYSEFSRSGATYTPFPDPRSHRIKLADLVQPKVRETLRAIWTQPDSLDPARASARVTREVAAQLAELAKSLEQSGHRADHVAAFLTRCLFCMFAEDVELLPTGSFLKLLQTWRELPATSQHMLRDLWTTMDHGGFSAALAAQVLHFNGKLFKEPSSEGYSLLLNQEQIELLIAAAQANWREVEPAIFGTLLERALDPTERHALGAHYTPRAYVERLVLPTVVEPLRADWANAQAASLVLAQEASELSGKAYEAKMTEARAEVSKFHHQLCTTRVLDPACGSGNFLYVTLEHLKRLEGEVLNQFEAFGQTQGSLALEGETVTLQQLRGIELNDRAAALAELVLWIGFLQWHIRTRGNKAVAEPVVHNYGNIECRDAVLAWTNIDLMRSEEGQVVMRWDGKTKKIDPVTGEEVPDESAQAPEWVYSDPSQANWPDVDYVIGNPPFIVDKKMRLTLGNGYVNALRGAYEKLPDSIDFVLYWWNKSAQLLTSKKLKAFGFITTNSIRQTFNRRVIEANMSKGLRIMFAIPDHPWVDNADGAAVRIAMTVASLRTDKLAILQTVVREFQSEDGADGLAVMLEEESGAIHADLTIGADVVNTRQLVASADLSHVGMIPYHPKFLVTKEQASQLGLGQLDGLEKRIRPYRNGKDLTETPRELFALDMFGLTSEQLRSEYPAVYQWIQSQIKPTRDQDPRTSHRINWWTFAEPRKEMRKALYELPRYIATVMTAKHRVFQFLDSTLMPDQKLVVIAVSDAFALGVLSSQVHSSYALAAGSTLEDRPVYVKTTCFETFPFPDGDTGLTPELRTRIANLAEQIDAHRKQVLSQPGAAAAKLTLTGLYNVLEALREGRALNAKEKIIYTQGLVGVLKDLHDELDAAVLEAYGWNDAPETPELLNRLVALNARRAAEEKAGTVRWLRPEFQNPVITPTIESLSNNEPHTHIPRGLQADLALTIPEKAPLGKFAKSPKPAKTVAPAATSTTHQPWPATLPDQVRAVADVLASMPIAMPLDAIEARFKSRGAWKKSLPRILETLEALGRARREGDAWRS